jgi:hypothetical protein
MNTTMTMPLNASQDDTLAFLAFPAKRAAEQVSGTTDELFKSIGTILNDIMMDMLSTRTATQYCAARDSYLATYMQVMLGLSKLISATVKPSVIDRLTYESLSEMEADFRDCGAQVFGEDMKDQALFTVWTLRKINDLTNQICSADAIEPHLLPTDHKMASMFVSHVLYGRFHLDCMKASLRTNTPIYPEVLDCVSDGLRAVVNAYAYIKQASDLRCKPHSEDMIMIDFDEEEQELLAASMKDAFLEA